MRRFEFFRNRVIGSVWVVLWCFSFWLTAAEDVQEDLRKAFLKVVKRYEAEKGLERSKRIPTLEELKLFRIPQCERFIAKILPLEKDPIIIRTLVLDCAVLATERTLNAALQYGLPRLKPLIQRGAAPDPLVPRAWISKDEKGYRMLPRFYFEDIAGLMWQTSDARAKSFLVKKSLSTAAARDPLFVQFLVTVIARIDHPDRAKTLRAVLRRFRQASVIAAVFDAAREAGLADAALARDGARLLRDPLREVQVAIVLYLERTAPEVLRKELPKLVKSKTPEVRLLAVGTITSCGGDPTLLYSLVDDPDWRVRIMAFRSVGQLATAEAVERLIGHLVKETHPRARDDLVDTLRRVTGVDMGPFTVAWQSWWRANKTKADLRWRDSQELGDLKARKPASSRTASYYGLAILSKHVCFLMDSSKSMDEYYTVEISEGSGRTRAKRPRKVRTRRARKIDYARENLKKVLAELPPDVSFNIVAFSSTPRVWRDSLIPKTPDNLQQAKAYLDDLSPSGSTNIFDSLLVALKDPEVDTLYLLSDGAPTSGTYTETERILQEVRRVNLFRKVKINTIGFNLKGEAKKLMQRLAEENFGAFVAK